MPLAFVVEWPRRRRRRLYVASLTRTWETPEDGSSRQKETRADILRPQFVQSLANPFYLNHLASQKLLSQPAFVAYLAYLRYWSRPPYLQYLTHPGPTLRHLELLQQERFRQDIMSPDLVARLVDEEMRASVQWHREA